MKPTGSRSLLPRGVYYPARGDVGCSGARGSLPDRTSSTPSRDTTRRLVVVVRPPHRHPPHTPRNQTLQKGWAPCKTRSLAAAEQPFPRRSARSGGCTKPGRQLERTGEHGREAGPGRRAAVRGGGEGGRGGRRPRGASGQRPSASRLALHAPRRGPRPDPGRRDRGRARLCRTPGPRRPRAHHLPLTAERDRTGRRGAARPVSLCHAVLHPPPRRRCRRLRRRCRRGAPAPSVPLGNNVIPHTPHT